MNITNVGLINRGNYNRIITKNVYSLFIAGYEGIIFEKELPENFSPKILEELSIRANPLKLRDEFNKINDTPTGVGLISKLKTRIRSLEASCNLLKQENHALKSKSMGYGKYMEEYSSNLNHSENESYQIVGKIAKILSGNYHGTIEDIKLEKPEGNETSPYLWIWEDRINAVKQIYEMKKDKIKSTENETISPLFSIININKYVTTKYKPKIDGLKKLLLPKNL